MRIEELSIGDWVMNARIEGKPTNYRITEIHWNCIVAIHSNGVEYNHRFSDVKPIPLTPEILEKNGISKTYESDEYTVYKGEGFNVTEYYTELWEFERHRNRLMIRYIHQLQHALRLAGVEKEIEL